MSSNWHRIEQDLKTRRQALVAEAEQYRLVRQSQRPQLNLSFLRRVLMRLKLGSGSAQPRLNQQPAA